MVGPKYLSKVFQFRIFRSSVTEIPNIVDFQIFDTQKSLRIALVINLLQDQTNDDKRDYRQINSWK